MVPEETQSREWNVSYAIVVKRRPARVGTIAVFLHVISRNSGKSGRSEYLSVSQINRQRCVIEEVVDRSTLPLF
ncbi:hypothetical protein FNV43_RR00345 [Rhamnella rubrinervis]|uniref:Uncharacterized protein n=1 Tax=Rhamnella rubrinervis TaxID=2594499 RepID=A0A8K0HPD6_9ROSA|nr:hypothetical protein FNV43_RR00345 [Rhamnella rubrinervis]